MGSINRVLHSGLGWCHMANTVERSDAVSCHHHFGHLLLLYLLLIHECVSAVFDVALSGLHTERPDRARSSEHSSDTESLSSVVSLLFLPCNAL